MEKQHKVRSSNEPKIRQRVKRKRIKKEESWSKREWSNTTELDGQRSSIGKDRGPEMKLIGEKQGYEMKWKLQRETVESHRLHNFHS